MLAIDNIGIALLLTLVAGMATCIGGCIVFFTKSTRSPDRFLGVCLAFSSGIMIYISFTEIFRKAQQALGGDTFKAFLLTNVGFFGGIAIMALIGAVLPEKKAPSSHIMMAGIYAVAATTIHNFPEGLATFMAVLEGGEAAPVTFFALAIHNIPEGFAVAVPIAYATGKKMKGFASSLLSGIAEPIGALLGWFFLKPIMTEAVSGMIFAATSGIMVYLCFNELIPLSLRYCGKKLSVICITLGFLVIASSLILLSL